jgi:putative ABC transport system permease protein
MNRIFYPKLALNNLVKNAQTYIPYLLTSIGTIMTFYVPIAVEFEVAVPSPAMA